MRSRKQRILAAYGFFIAGAFAVSLAMNITAVLSWRVVPLPLAIAVIAALSPCIYLVARPYWARLDDRQREGGMTSWFWGSFCGLVFGVTSALAIGGFTPGHFSEFAKGALYVVIVQLVGTVIASLIRWQSNRSAASEE
jgi:MFS family permease